TLDPAMTCLAYLKNNAFDEVCSDCESMENRVQTYRFCLYAAQFWGFHCRGEAETSSCIYQAVFRLLASENKRNSILQMTRYADSTWDRLSFTNGQTLLHIIAKTGLATISRYFLDRKPKRDLYIAGCKRD